MPDQSTPRRSRSVVATQWLLGLGSYLLLVCPYVRRVHGFNRLRSDRRWLFVSNHVSLLDTILLGGLCWRSGCLPFCVLGDKKVWHASWVKRFLSRHIGFLLERGRPQHDRLAELEAFGRAGRELNLLVFPEGTRGDGVNVAPCQPGLHYIAREAQLPIVPIFIENMHLLSTKNRPVHPFQGLRKLVVHIGPPIPPEDYLPLGRDAFGAFIRQRIATLPPMQSADNLNPVAPQA